LPAQAKGVRLEITERVRAQTAPTIALPVRAAQARASTTCAKAVEMGVSRLQPVFTRHAERTVNLARMRANIEAAEQCGILTVAEIAGPIRLRRSSATTSGACWCSATRMPT
jgi:16S rRNA (uracil1498-N3)-methyltransferase